MTVSSDDGETQGEMIINNDVKHNADVDDNIFAIVVAANADGACLQTLVGNSGPLSGWSLARLRNECESEKTTASTAGSNNLHDLNLNTR